MILPRAYGFIFSRVLVFFPFYGLAKFKGLHDYARIGIKKTLRNMAVGLCYIITRARIGLEIIYSTACLLGRYGVNSLKLRCKRVSLFW